MPSASLGVGIVGSRLDRLSAAIAIRRQEHRVVVYERYDFANEVGASLSFASNGSRFLEQWEVDIPAVNVEKGFIKFGSGNTATVDLIIAADGICNFGITPSVDSSISCSHPGISQSSKLHELGLSEFVLNNGIEFCGGFDINKIVMSACHSGETIVLHITNDLNKPYPYWHKGKIGLLGDAAHPMLPNQSQGFCHIFSDEFSSIWLNDVGKERASRVQAARARTGLSERIGWSSRSGKRGNRQLRRSVDMNDMLAHIRELVGQQRAWLFSSPIWT
ncbi:hypothetical protein F5882DRAFT_447682 [Hyaloscypha sp. PMI_1271]|nr:hypothetical protein F5882DRAFT_447682 [Hyaloscypha sp. PMI_1271]